MTVEISHTSEACSRIKGMGYAPGKKIHIYGEKFEVLSDPFAEGAGIGIRVKQGDGNTRVLQLPASLLQPPKRKWAA
jgi:hypothetical protein